MLFEVLVTAPLLLVLFDTVAPVAGAARSGPADSEAVEDDVLPLEVLVVPLPLGPVSPELPVIDTGSAMDVELAAPVLPVLVLEFWAVAAPLSPLSACGVAAMLPLPPSPPLAEVSAIASPPLTPPTWKVL